MRSSLQKRAALIITIVIVAISSISTYLFSSAYNKSRRQNRILRGETLAYTLSKTAEDGLLKEDLDILRKASYVIQAPDVMRVQVFSSIWSSIDAYPFDQLLDPPHPDAVAHFASSTAPINYETDGAYDFYSPVVFRPFEDSNPITIGYVRLTLSTASLQKEIRTVAVINIFVAAGITVMAILSLTTLLRRLVIRPVLELREQVISFRHGKSISPVLLHPSSTPELKSLAQEFCDLCAAVRDKEAKLVESSRRIHSLFNRVEHGIFRLDATGAIIEANERFQAIFGKPNGLCDVLIGERNARECLRAAGQSNVFFIEDKAVDKHGNEIFVALSLYPEKTDEGTVTGFDGYIIDITEKKRLEERLIRAQKLEAVGTLAGGMAHDFNNLLTAILGYSGIILKTTPENDPVHKHAEVIHNAAKRGAEFGKKILTITRKEKMETRPVNLNEIVSSAIELLSRSMPKNIEIVTRLEHDLPITNADPAQMQQVVINLAVNARDAMPNGGKLTVETSSIRSNGTQNGFSGNGGAFIRISVSDTGVGIDSETQTKIFDPFFTTKDMGKGTGLGLYIVQSIVNKHGGYINLYSEPGRGTKFNVYIPVTKPEKTEDSSAAADLRGEGTVLVIDDEQDVRGLCKDILEPLGYKVLTAENGPSGINIYRANSNAISLVILDMIMPRMGGPEVFSAIRTINPDARILLYSGYSNANFAGIDDLLKQGAVGFIQKPFSPTELAMYAKKAIQSSSS